jgi:hypothetical protein
MTGVDSAVARLREASRHPLRAVFLTRALNALVDLSALLPEREVGEVSQAPSDYAVLLRGLEMPEATEALQRYDPLAAARLRGLRAKERLLQAEGGTISAEEAGRRLHLTRQAVDKRRRAGRLLALSGGRRGYAYPLWQFQDHGLLPGLPEVFTDLSRHDAWMQLAFFLQENPYLDGAVPLVRLRQGDVAAVRRAAQGYGEHGAP